MVKKKKVRDYDRSKKYFWAPNMYWKIIDNLLIINGVVYHNKAMSLFPEFYFYMQDGQTVVELEQKFSSCTLDELDEIVIEFIRNKVLAHDLPEMQDLFLGLERFTDKMYDEEMFLNPEKLNQFKEEQLNRQIVKNPEEVLRLASGTNYPQMVAGRRTHRTFHTDKQLDWGTFSECLSIFKQSQNNGHRTYYYGSAGGLYPIDLYIYVKENRVKGLDGGLYYYSPVENSIVLISSSCVITNEVHFYTNQEIFKQSAFSIFFIYNADVTMAKYAGLGYLYAAIDTGIMVELFTCISEMNHIGICSIGNLNFDKIKKYFGLGRNQVLLHVVEAGLKE